MQPDTIIASAGHPQAFNRYSYVNNSPISYNDPSGHRPKPCWATKRYSCNLSQDDIDKLVTSSDKNSRRFIFNLLGGPTHLFLFCGVGDGNNCDSENGTLNGYKAWANENGIQTSTYDVDGCNGPLSGKANCFLTATDNILSILKSTPNANFLFIGHSAGADAAVFTAHYLLETGRISHLKGLVLLDPTLTITLPGDKPGEWTDLQTNANEIAGRVPTLLVTTPTEGGITIPGAYRPGSDAPNYDPNTGLLNYSHMDIALSVDVSSYIINKFLNPSIGRP